MESIGGIISGPDVVDAARPGTSYKHHGRGATAKDPNLNPPPTSKLQTSERRKTLQKRKSREEAQPTPKQAN
ncbi:6a412753-3017-4978-80d8-118dfd9593bc [Thermothielavioides terrestris]|uniref:6a412753-3017-4978-80d8-118dfd9593bc n=1 Tax=Thermothielavioides terrestris TaxID=2587410 RepID=A0A446BT27_9PEZI|nr:6a412753-3017-4978-80d8-118dfd9593bc [Thermothielavioides terrestris]